MTRPGQPRDQTRPATPRRRTTVPPQPPTWRSLSRSPPAAEARPGQPHAHPRVATTRPGQPRQGGDGAHGWLEDGQAAASTTSGLPDLASSGDAREDGDGNGGRSGEGEGRGQWGGSGSGRIRGRL